MVQDTRAAGLREKWRSDVPLLYDQYINHHMQWPSLACRWGAVQVEHEHHAEQKAYLSEQTDGSAPNALLVATVSVPKLGSTQPEHLWEEWDEEQQSCMINTHKIIYHPGEVNRIRELPQHPHIVATHTDSPEVLVWNTEAQPPRGTSAEENAAEPSSPDLVLKGHKANAEFALASCPSGPFVLSGGKDSHVALWCLEDHIITPSDEDGNEEAFPNAPSISARSLFKGHRDTVEDVQFKPNATEEFCSVGDDHCLLLWDSRSGTTPVIRVERAHKKDVHCVDWSPHNDNFILTGSADHTVRVFDRRVLPNKGHSQGLLTLNNHTEAVVSVQWSPTAPGVFASAGDDGLINIVKVDELGGLAKGSKPALHSDIILKHLGHREKVADIHWNPHEPWTVLSCSIDTGKRGGGTIQVWRPSQLLWQSEEEALQHLDAQQAA